MIEKFEGQSLVQFYDRFPDDNACKEYLYYLKWQNGFQCPKCGHTACWEGPKPFYKVCKDCRHAASPTANTLFHKVKFGLRKAFIIVYEMVNSTKSLSSIQMGKRLGIRQGTAWYFMQKVRKAMKSSQQEPLEGDVEVDEFVVGGREENKPGRSYDTKKKKAAIALELTEERKVKRAYIRAIEDFSAKALRPLFEGHIAEEAQVTTDKWTAYKSLKGEWAIEQIDSNKGLNFSELHTIIQQVKSWIRCVPSHVSGKYFQAYLDEFCYRLNRSIFKDTIAHKTLERMALYQTISCPLN